MSNSVFQEKIKSNKVLLCIIAIAILAVDLFLSVVLAIGGELFTFGLAIFIITILDVVLLICVFSSNFRLRYSIALPIIYIIVTLLIGGLLAPYMAKKVFTLVAYIIFGVFRVVSVIALIFGLINGANRGKRVKAIAFILSIILLGLSAFYVYNVIPKGFFGQGGFGVRNIAYDYDQEKDGYVASIIDDNNGEKIIVANQFNGKKVVGVNANLFTSEEVKEVNLQCDAGFFIEDEWAIRDLNSALVISVDKSNINQVRSSLYKQAQGKASSLANGYVELSNRITPDKLDKDEIYINFDYSYEDLEYAEFKVIDTWFGKKGDTFSLKDHAGSISYVGDYDLTNEQFLKENYDRGGKVIDQLVYEGQEINNNVVNVSMPNTKIAFEYVRKVFIQEDNDMVYNLYSEDKDFSKGGADRYVLQSDPNNLLSGIKARLGFTVSFKCSALNSLTKTPVEKLSDNLTQDIKIYPEWKLNAPKISSVQGDKVYTYGDTLNISATASHDITENVEFEYAWTKGSSTTVLSTNNFYEKSNVKPLDDTATYKLLVTAKASCTSLSSTAQITAGVNVNKKQLSFTWDKAETIYSGVDQKITATYNVSDVINADTIEGYIDGDQLITDFTSIEKNAGLYNYSIKLTGECDDLYFVNLSNITHAWTIKPYEVEVSWLDTAFVYNSFIQRPTVNAMNGIGSELSNPLEFSYANTTNNGIIAGNHTVEVFLSDSLQANNYKITNPTKNYSIDKKPITISWQDLSLTYNALAQKPTATANDICSGDSCQVVIAGAKTSVGSYTASATLTNANYKIEDTYQTSLFTISPKAITLSWDTATKTYSFKEQVPTASAIGLCGSDAIEFNYSGHGKNVGSYTASATIKNNANYFIDGSNTFDFEIVKKNLTLEWHNTTLTYNGLAQKPTVKLVGVITGDTCTPTVSLYGEGINVGTYGAKTTIDNLNYQILSADAVFTITPKQLVVTAKPISIIYGDAPTNDGYTISGFVNGENQSVLSGAVTYTYSYSIKGAVGTYKITPSGLTADNYSFNYVKGDLKVLPRQLSVKIDNKSSIYGTAITTLTGVITSGELVSGDSTPYQLKTMATQSSSVGEYVIYGEVKNSNYDIDFTDGVYTITKATLTVNANTITEVTYGFTGSIEYKTIRTTNNGRTPLITYNCSVNSTSDVGEYAYTFSYDSVNYDLVVLNEENFIVKVNPKQVSISWNYVASSYTLENYTSLKPTVNGATLSDLNLFYQYQVVSGGTVVDNKPTTSGKYMVSVKAQNSNYKLVGTASVQFTIKTASIG